MSANVSIDDAAIDELTGTFSGELVRPNDASYEEARCVHNGLVDKRPSLIARCRGTADVQAAVMFATQRGVPSPFGVGVTTSPAARCSMTGS
jgi:hypothetical protein